ncbi:ATP-binding protein [Salinigranum salinum]|uniref:ATP-binding protein n=1 Tax=Salinigranum salinum TaxID=1364937 RepID=UPI00126072B5|nr:HAMP domain-containing sensor histidine kinase [Salinigranum salinum]
MGGVPNDPPDVERSVDTERVLERARDVSPAAGAPAVSRPVADGGRPPDALFESFPDPLLAYTCERETGTDEQSNATGSAGRIVVDTVNPAFETTFEIAATEIAGTPLDELILPRTAVSDTERDEPTAEPGETETAAGTTTVASVLNRTRGSGRAGVGLRHESDDETCYFRVRTVTTSHDEEYLLFTDVTEGERRRRDLATTVARLERIASVVSHDLRNPLEVAKIRLEAAQDTGDAVHFEKLEDALDRIEHLVRDVLTIGGGGVDPTGTVAIRDVAEAAWETVDTADATLVTAASLPTVRGDADHLQRLFENLFRNAVEHGSTDSRTARQSGDATERGGRVVTVRVEPLENGFLVDDDGPGVPPELRDRAFEAGTSTVSGNRGLGLSIVSQVARDHGWDVSLAVNTDGGARFEFTGVEVVENAGGGHVDEPAGSNEPERSDESNTTDDTD